MPYIQNASAFLIEAIFNFALYVVLLRFWMQWVRADFRNDFGQFIISATNPVIIPIRRVIPSIGVVDTATVLLAVTIALIKFYVLVLLAGGGLTSYSLLKLLSVAVAAVLDSSIYVFLGAILVGIIASWVNPNSYHPILSIARSISEPLLAPARKLIPSMGGIDFSPMLVILFLRISQMLLIAPLYRLFA
ncbi:MAG: YggT family protein [Arenicella sp.]|jgi:YggT family protein